jgi:hypothetical protein
MIKNEFTLLSAKELSSFIKFSPDYINRKLKDNVFLRVSITLDLLDQEKYFTF